MGDFDLDGDFDLEEVSFDPDLTDMENPDRWEDPFQYGAEYPDEEFDSLEEWDDDEY